MGHRKTYGYTWGTLQYNIPVNRDAVRELSSFSKSRPLAEKYILAGGGNLWNGMKARLDLLFNRINETGFSREDKGERRKQYSEIEDIICDCSSRLPNHRIRLARMVTYRLKRFLSEPRLQADKRNFAKTVLDLYKSIEIPNNTRCFLSRIVQKVCRTRCR